MDASGRGGALARREPAGDAFVDVNGYLECCKDAVSHLESSLSQDKAFPPRWPFEPSSTYFDLPPPWRPGHTSSA